MNEHIEFNDSMAKSGFDKLLWQFNKNYIVQEDNVIKLIKNQEGILWLLPYVKYKKHFSEE